MLNRAFRLVLCLISFYVLCVMFFNVWIGNFKTLVNVSLVTSSVLLVFQIISLIGLYKFNRGMLKTSLLVEILLILSIIMSMFVFRYFMAVEIVGLMVSALTLGLLFCTGDR